MTNPISRYRSNPQPSVQTQGRRVIESGKTSQSGGSNPVHAQYMQDQFSYQPGYMDGLQNSGQSLVRSPQYLNAYSRAGPSDRMLLDQLKSLPNATAAFEAYQCLRGGAQNPARLSDGMVHDLTMGVANSRGVSQVGTEGLLSPSHVRNVKDALLGMPQQQFDQFASTYGNASESSAGVERQLLLKAVGARSSALGGGDAGQASSAMGEVVRFGQAVRGLGADQLIEGTSMLQTANSMGYAQKYNMSCPSAVRMTLMGEQDPVFAWQVRSNSQMENAAIEQSLVLGNGKTLDALEDGQSINDINRLYGTQALDPRKEYVAYSVTNGSLPGYLNQAATALRDGGDVPFVVTYSKGDGTFGGHNLSIEGVEGRNGQRFFKVHDNGSGGQTKLVPEQDLLNGSFLQKHFGWNENYSDFSVVSMNIPRNKIPAAKQQGPVVVQDPKVQQQQAYEEEWVQQGRPTSADLDDDIEIDEDNNDDIGFDDDW
ncbi:MAG: hypothetical protein HY901_16855 [Deltaproteobacteria bacterium]|nr:hypothetical protein [Deltaproteobacteria bacterium]